MTITLTNLSTFHDHSWRGVNHKGADQNLLFQHWKGVLLCLALVSHLMVEAAPARAGAMKKGSRLVASIHSKSG